MEILNLDKNKYIVIIPIDEIDYDFEKKIVIVNQLFMEESNKYTIKSNKNAMIFFGYNQLENDGQINNNEYISFYNILKTYSSPFNNMKFAAISKASQNINTNFILENYLNFPIYIGQSEQNMDITVKRYEPRYAFFGAIDNNLFQNYLDYLKYIILINNDGIMQLNTIFPLVIRLNSDILPFNEYFNFYLSEKLKGKLKLYVRKIYGPLELYECDAESLDKFDFSIITKPLSSCKNKRSLFNRLITFNETKIFSGYLDINSYFDIYIDLEEEENTDIKVSSYAYYDADFKNTGKYLTKDKEYNLILEGEFMAKLESGFDAKVTIYDEDNTIILTLEPNKPSGRLEGQNLKIKSDNDAMVYFYRKLSDWIKQVKINNESGKNIILKNVPLDGDCKIDIGFEGFSPLNYDYDYVRPKYSDGKLIYTYLIENIYDKLKIKLAEGESLYFYYYDYSQSSNKENDEKEDEKYEEIYEEEEEIPSEEIEIDYSFNNLDPPQNDYTFMVIPKTDEKKSNLIINNANKQYIRYQINYCKNSLNNVKMHYYKVSYDEYYDDKTIESEFVFSKEQTILDLKMPRSRTDLRFESSDEFIFSYSFMDYTDEEFNDKEQWNKEREELKELKISEITKLEGVTYSLKFKPNYKNSLTRYIIVIAEKDENNTEENFNNPCYITKLVTEKADGIKIINIYDNGEKEFISVDLELSDFLKLQSEYIISIISQELRFEKKIHYYEATTFEYNLDPIEIEMGKEQEFNQEKIYFKLDAVKKSNLNEMFLINYNLEQQTPLKVKITKPDKQREIYDINKKEGFLNFLWDQSDIYMIYFQFAENYYLKSNINGIKGTFNILSTESAFNLDLTKDNIEFEEFSMMRDEAPSLKFIVSC